jgi:RimJ/RimL family protein N-acetyltransferase
MVQIPTLETTRLILRPFRESDRAALADIHGRAEVARFVLGNVPQPRLAQAFEYIALALGHWSLRGAGKWAVEERASGRMIGRCGYNDMPDEWPGLELGWTFHSDVWGRGYATEAASAALNWGFAERRAGRIIHLIDPENTSSQKVAKRLGAVEGGMWEGRGFKLAIWGQTRETWLARRPVA